MYNSDRTGRNENNRTRSTLVLTQAEPIVGDGTYKSPELYVAELDPKFTEGINYTGGSAVYEGLDTIQIEVETTVSVKGTNAGITILVTSGVNSTPSTAQEIETKLTSAGDIKELTHHGTFEWKTGDIVDFFISATSNITIEKAVWKISRVD